MAFDRWWEESDVVVACMSGLSPWAPQPHVMPWTLYAHGMLDWRNDDEEEEEDGGHHYNEEDEAEEDHAGWQAMAGG